ncbi:STAS domain-containing protein [Amycolatopsis sp. OK19-0408]|uniref:STAS domain-containing protein n=1 Tax=Amycolatopsis iheyensis TaxID=2945988 RepID=A0A9X2NCX9_9PSEU|nr:STAS domain-containing protein [Amycolatopsis iheyensis]MCR6484971.1 STAS domain-containing protein [Amycolatopsis iheyensis]
MSKTPEASVVAAAGELDLAVSDRLTALLDREVRAMPPALLFDATAVTFCAARVLTVLLDTTADASVLGVPFAVAGRSRALLRPVTVLRLEQVLPIHEDTDEALAWLGLLPRLTEPV